MTTRHQPYYDLLEAAQAGGCPLCRLARRSADRYLDILSYENINDVGVRERLRASRGLCRRHADHLLGELHDGLGTAILYRDLLRTLSQELRTTGGRQPAALAPAGPCPACQAQARAIALFGETLTEHAGDPVLRRALDQGGGLCQPHRLLLPPHRRPALVDLLRRPLAPDWPALAGISGGLPADDRTWWIGLALPAPADEHAPWPPGPALCPACAAAGGAVRQHLDRVAAAPVDPSRVLALCPDHRQALARRGVPAPLVGGAADGGTHQPGPTGWWAWIRGWRRPGAVGRVLATLDTWRRQCPACQAALTAAVAVVDCLHARAETALFCLAHFVLALQRRGPWPRLIARHLQAWDWLATELGEYIRKNDYRFRGEPWGPEATAPARAVALVAGRRPADGCEEERGTPRAVPSD